MSVFTLVPVKKLSETKKRLSPILNAEERRAFALAMLLDVLRAISASSADKTVLIGSDTDVKRLSLNWNADFLSDTGEELNQVLQYATDWSVHRGAEAVLVLPADVPLVTAEDIDQVTSFCSDRPSVAVSPSRGEGTNALMRNPPRVMPTYFGPESFKRHLHEASKLGIRASIYKSASLSLDIDIPRDLKLLLKLGDGTKSQRFLESNDIRKRFE